MFSHRNIVDCIFARCVLYEFEDVIRKIDSVEMLSPKTTKFYKYGERLASRIAYETPFALNPGIPKINIEREYDLFFTICAFPSDLINLTCLQGWYNKCKTSVCWIDEFLLNELMNIHCFKRLISKFDHVVVGCKQGIDKVKKIIQGECLFSPPGIDAILFCPYPNLPSRSIDVVGIGRKSEKIHKELLKKAAENKIFYFYDTGSGNKAINFKQHRLLLSNITKRSKFFLINYGKFDQPQVVGNEYIIGSRFFEGAASGNIMIGTLPRSNDFNKMFHWEDAVIPAGKDGDDIVGIINELNQQSDRLRIIRGKNVSEMLKYHDWSARWELVLNTAKLEPLTKFYDRKKYLNTLETMIE